MANYKISGVWKNGNNAITHYAVHTVGEKDTSKAEKMSKIEVVALLDKRGITAYTWVWDYIKGKWGMGEKVEVVHASSGKYLRTDPDRKATDNLAHLPDFDWVSI